MDNGQSAITSVYLSALFGSGTLVGMSDRELLERFASWHGERDESAELAFATIVARHGAMVLRVCRGVLGDLQEAEDSFQATYLVLASRAVSLMEGALKTMVTTKLMLFTTTVLVAGLVTTGAGVAAYSALRRREGVACGQNPAQGADRKQAP